MIQITAGLSASGVGSFAGGLTMKSGIVVALLAAVGCTSQSEVDRMCRAIGETRQIALQPKDRIFWEDHCQGPVAGGEESVAASLREQSRMIAEKKEKEEAARRELAKAHLAKLGEPLVSVAKGIQMDVPEAG